MHYDSLVIGKGEVGSSVKRVLMKRKKKQKCGIIDRKDKDYKVRLKNTKSDTLHICYPYSHSFEKEALKYIRELSKI